MTPTVSNILSKGIVTYLDHHKLSWKQQKVVNKIINCCSPNASKQKISCTNEECGYTEIRNRPCGDRHCNRCNNNKKLKWMTKMMKDFLSVPYHHVVFTLPEELRNLSICNQALVYDIFFKSCFYVLHKFSSDEKYFGGKLGFIGLLHTWGQTLCYHPHIHFMVMCGGIKDGKYKQLPYSKKFLFPVKAMSKVMMGKFIELVKEKYCNGEIRFSGKLESISEEKKFNSYLYLLSKKEWVIFNKAPLNGSSKVLEYLSRYTHKVAIANGRIKEYSNEKVTFKYKDYKDSNRKGIAKEKIMTLTEVEFIRRYLLHILPNGFRKLRYGGIFSSNQKRNVLPIILEYFEELLERLTKQYDLWYWKIRKYVEVLCPKCHEKLLVTFDSS